jgi:hypothetical protein
MRDESDPRIGQISYLLSCLISNKYFRQIIGNIIIPKYKGHTIYNFFGAHTICSQDMHTYLMEYLIDIYIMFNDEDLYNELSIKIIDFFKEPNRYASVFNDKILEKK